VSLTELIEDSPILQTDQAGVFIPLKKKRVNFEILINRLERLGIRGIVLNYSNLKDRKQFVKLGDDCSGVACFVHQRSVLGLKLCILYINDTCKLSELLKCVLFADDTNVFGSGQNLEQLLDSIT